jgi:hypothetical protein
MWRATLVCWLQTNLRGFLNNCCTVYRVILCSLFLFEFYKFSIKSVAHSTSLINLFTATCFGYNCYPSSGLLWTPILLTYSIEESPSWEAKRFSASQEIPHILWNLKVHYRIHKCPPPVPILNQLHQSKPPHPTSWRSILTLSSHLRLGLPSSPFLSGFPTKTLHTPLLSPITHKISPSH